MAFLGYYVFRSGPLLLKSFNQRFIAESKGVEIPLDPNTSCPKSEQALNHRFIAVEPHCCVDSVLNCIHLNLVLSCSNYFQLGSCLVWMHNVTRSSIRLNNVFHLWRLHRCLPKKTKVSLYTPCDIRRSFFGIHSKEVLKIRQKTLHFWKLT